MQRIILHKIICSFLICAFALSITPVFFLHTLVANHKDGYVGLKKDNTQKISKSTLNCNVENCVAHSPFVPTIDVTKNEIAKHFINLNIFYKNDFYSRHHFFCELRGPPFC